jgi:hypothetical protein
MSPENIPDVILQENPNQVAPPTGRWRKPTLILGLCLLVAVGALMGILMGKRHIPITSDERPYSVLVASYKTLEEANQTADRLNKRNILAYVLKKALTDADFSMDVHAGAYKEARDAEKLLSDLQKLGLSQPKVIKFDEIKKTVTQFENLRKDQKAEFTLAKAEAPSLSQVVLENISIFPIDQNFRITKLKIEDCAHSLETVTGISALPLNPEIIPDGISLPALHRQSQAISQVIYEDKLFNHHIGLTIATVKDPEKVLSDLVKDIDGKVGRLVRTDLAYRTAKGIMHGFVYEQVAANPVSPSSPAAPAVSPASSLNQPGAAPSATPQMQLDSLGQYTYLAAMPESSHLLIMNSHDTPGRDFLELINNGGNNYGLLTFPEIRKNLFVLPKITDKDDLVFSCFDLFVVPAEYARQRNDRKWAKQVVGNYLASGNYIHDKWHVSFSFFNLVRAATAENTQQFFKEDHVRGAYGNPEKVMGKEGWYLDMQDSPWRATSELSFSQGSYVIAVDIVSRKDLYGLLEFGRVKRLKLLQDCTGKLQIW